MLVKPLVRPICRQLTSAITAALGGGLAWPPTDPEFPISKLVSAYLFTDATDTAVADVKGTSNINLTLPTNPNVTKTSKGLKLASGLIQTPSLTGIRAQTILYRTDSTPGGAGYLISGGSGSGLGTTQEGVNIAESTKVAGFGLDIFTPPYRTDTGGACYALNRGGWAMLHREMASTFTSIFGLGGRHSTTTSRCAEFEINCAFFWNSVLTTTEQNAVHRYVRRRAAAVGVPIHRDDTAAKSDLYMVLGESNADGRSLIADLSGGDQATDTTRTIIAAGQGGIPTVAPAVFDLGVNQKFNSAPGSPVATMFGPEFGVAFARSTAPSGDNFALIAKVGLGGTRLAPSSVGGTPATTWNPNELPSSGLFYFAYRQVLYTLQSMVASGYGFNDTVRIGLWLGLNDAVSTTYASSAATYQGYLQAFYDKLVALMPGVTVELVCFRPHTSDPSSDATAIANIRTAYADFAAANPNVTLVDTDSQGLMADSVHYNAAANKSMGSTLHG